MIPFVSALIAMALVALAREYRSAPVKKFLVVGLALVVLISHGVAMNKKRIWLQNGNDAAVSLRRQVTPYLPLVPHNGTVWLVNRPLGEKVEYGHYLIRGTGIICPICLHKFIGRADVQYCIVDPEKFDPTKPGPNDLMLKLKGAKFEPYQLPGHGTR